MVAASGTPRERLRVSNRSVVALVVIVLGAMWATEMLGQAGRVLGWLTVACIGAALLHPVVSLIALRIPRPAALILTLLLTLGTIGGLVYSGIGDVRAQADRVEREAPRAAARIAKRDDWIGNAARSFDAERRITEFVDDLPTRLQGGDTATALRSAATRGVAFFATAMLTLFLLIHGPRLVNAGLRQIHDDERRARIKRVAEGGYKRAWRYIVFTLGRALLAGTFAFAVGSAIDVPGQTVLAIWVAAWSVVPLVGVVTGSIPLVLLSVTVDFGQVPWVFAMFVGYQLAEAALLQRRIERVSVHVGPFVTLVAAFGGLEAYGVGGMFVAVVLATATVGVLAELADEGEVIEALDAVLAGDEPA
jgi:predicted PurR-regulated permease PerM